MIYVNGLGSTNWLDGSSKGEAPRNANLSWINTHVDAWVDQRYDQAQAVSQLKNLLDQRCVGANWCYPMVYSNGGAVATEVLSVYGNRWKIAWVFTTSGNQGGSELATMGWLSNLFGGSPLASGVGPAVHRRPGFNHNAVPVAVYHVGCAGCLWGTGETPVAWTK